MRISQSYIQRSKAGVHILQALLTFIGGCLALVVLTKDGETGGQVSFYFALCFLTLPAIVYQTMVPMWTRVWRFANVYAYASIDVSYAILWLVATIAVASWEATGVREGEKGKDEGEGLCSHFAYGSESKCETARASAGFGSVVFLLFAMTGTISVHGVMKYRKTGIMLNGNSKTHGMVHQLSAEDLNKDVWSTNTDELNPYRHSDDQSDPRRAYGQLPREEDEQGLLHQPSIQDDSHSMLDTHTEDGLHPGRPLSFQSNMDLSIKLPPAYREQVSSADDTVLSPTGYIAPSALSPSDYAQTPGGRISFPRGNY